MNRDAPFWIVLGCGVVIGAYLGWAVTLWWFTRPEPDDGGPGGDDGDDWPDFVPDDLLEAKRD